MYDTCMDVDALERIGIGPFMELINHIGGSNITSEHWTRENYNTIDTIVRTKRLLNIDLFFRTGVWINPKNSSRHVFFVSPNKYVKVYHINVFAPSVLFFVVLACFIFPFVSFRFIFSFCLKENWTLKSSLSYLKEHSK